eukprot:6738976-Karenia_brevis.AAC.1
MMRAQFQGRQFDTHQAFSRFERNPFQWHGTARSDRVTIVTLWTWKQEEERIQVFQMSRVDHVLERGFPAPYHSGAPDDSLWRNLCAVAEWETQHGKAPCIYLGLAVSGGKFIAD